MGRHRQGEDDVTNLMLEWLYGTNRTEGLFGGVSSRGMRQGYVLYPDGTRSINMPLGNAADYKKIFGGRLVPIAERA